ncbi:sensor histidine kinase [Haloarcula onubensis]|uniref:histidine kinase n=1 Tax=Haloarcula onubensis TaxID=2950539 RepID=A0ABU2FM95_9EURY|nr:PAS domain-containing sensor histidine kinase [Halomicroarcula sp. S3CR25-11]MDS0281870.1 PAS domain-containing sensor histidine kinase [Halomicroarcula sp. S3CR25-11]
MAVEGSVLRRALDTLDDVIYIYDEADTLVYWNQRLNDLYGLSDAELSGTPATEFFGPADRPVIEAALEEIRETGETIVEAWSPTVEGPVRFELTGRRLTDEDGAVIGFAGIGRDVTERYEQAGQLSQQNERLDEFADLLAHDLRNPLSVASGHLALAREDDSGESLDAVAAAHERIGRIITDIRMATREGALATDTATTDVAQVAREAWEYVDTTGAVLDAPDGLQTEADAGRLLRLFENLFRNAMEHGRSDEGTVTVRLEATAEGFAVEDDGPGIDPEVRERIFDPGVSDAAGGTGFGLYIVRTIAAAHGWDVTVTGAANGGARFEFAC